MPFAPVTSTLRGVFRRKTILALLAACLPAGVLALPTGFEKKEIAKGLDGVFIAAAPDGRVFFTEKRGMIRVIKNDQLLPAPFADVSSTTNNANERGMIGIALDGGFASNGYVYATKSDKDGHDYVLRFKASAANPDVAEGGPTVIFDLLKHTGTYHHGMDLGWGNDGKLYVTRGNGDGAVGDKNALSKDHDEIWGSLLRINPDGTIPADNPFYGENQGDARAVWTYGNRNPFSPRFSKGGTCLFQDVMDSPGSDEINECKSGGGYGYGGGGGTGPLMTAGGGKAQVGGAFYEANQFPSAWQGRFFFGNSGNGRIRAFDPASKGSQDFDDLGGDCPIGFAVTKDGALWVNARCGTGAQSSVAYGKVFKITYPGNVATQPGALPGLRPEHVMRYSARPGAVTVELLGDGAQSLELIALSGRCVTKAVSEKRGMLRLSAPGARGMHILSWKSGERNVTAKLMLLE